MRSIILLASLLAFTSAYDLYSLAAAEWESYKAEFGKDYFVRAMDLTHMNAFLKAKKTIAEHNIKFHSGEVSYELGLNELSDLLPEEYRRNKLGLKVPSSYKRKPQLPIENHIDLPKSIDWREKGAVTPVKDQGDCGSCYAFSATGTLEGQHFRKTGKLVSLSEQQIVDCDKTDASCYGGFVETAFDYIKQANGIDTEQAYPYTANTTMCHFKKNVVGAKVVGYVDVVPNENELMKAVATIGPISISIFAPMGSFMHYKSGIFDNPKCHFTILNHAVLVVGYGTEGGKDYWIVKNSWGPKWGEAGYIRIVRGKNMCQISDDPIYPLV